MAGSDTLERRMIEQLDCAVIGGGVVGLAVTRRLAMLGRQVVLFEAEKNTGLHTSSRNSEVLHAGIYYPTGSLKARLCVQGRRMLEEFCSVRGLGYRRIGKIVVATSDDEARTLDRHKAQGESNGVTDLVWLEPDQVRRMEPAIFCTRAFHSPSTGLIDSHGLMRALAADARQAGADIVLASPVIGGAVSESGIDLDIGGREPARYRFRTVVNSAGYSAPAVARTLSGLDAKTIPTSYFAKGHYFVLSGPAPFRQLVYPIPGQGGLGIHVALDLAGNVRFGPDAVWVDRPDYGFDESRAAYFYGAIRRYFPALASGALQPGFVGVRAKLGRMDAGFVDFVMQGSEVHGVPGLLNLFGIDSPGLTSSLAIADEVARRLQ
jgi:L-2-hydroxyglutarate oxidase LhgO